MVKIQIPATPGAPEAEEVLLDAIALKGGRYEGKTLLYKAFYLAHLFYWAQHRGALTNYPIVHMPQGPGIDDGDRLIGGLIQRGAIKRTIERRGPYPCEVFTLEQPREIDPDNNPRQEAVRKAIALLGNMTATEASAWIHENSRSWRDAGSGDQLAIYLDLLTDDEYRQVKQSSAEAARLISDVFD